MHELSALGFGPFFEEQLLRWGRDAVPARIASEHRGTYEVHHRKLAKEAQAYERRHDQHLRRQAGRDWGQRYDEVARLRRWKGQ